MIKYGIIGLGNCGGQITAKAAKELDVNGIVLNTSDQDLEKVKDAGDNVHVFHLGDKQGAGQNRMEAKVALKEAIQVVVEDEDFKKFIKELEVIYIVSSTGGGTGSGIAPIMYDLVNSMSTATCILIGVLPTLEEDRGIQVNSLNYLNEIYNCLEDVRYMIYDNNNFTNLSSVNMMQKINQCVVNDIQILSGYFNTATEYTSMDNRDMLKVISSPGGIIVASVRDISEKDLDTLSIEERIIEDLKTNAHCEFDRDGIVQYTGIIVRLSERINETLNMNIPAIRGFIGEPKGTGFKHIYINTDQSLPNDAFFIASGMSPINDRIVKINERVAELDAKSTERSKATALESSVLGEGSLEEKKTGNTDISYIFERFGV